MATCNFTTSEVGKEHAVSKDMVIETEELGFVTTAKEFREYKKFVKKWIKKFRLESWNLFFKHSDFSDNPDQNLTFVVYDFASSTAAFLLSEHWKVPYTSELADMCAFHECLHLVFAGLMEFLDELPEEVVNVANKFEHQIIGCLESAVFGKNSRFYKYSSN